jgi:hypothetical protein
MKRSRVAVPVLVALLSVGVVAASDWPQYRGSNRDGKAVETGLLESWQEAAPSESWRRSVGKGFSGIAIADGRVFTMDEVDLEEAVLALDAASGDTLWRTVIGRIDPAAEELFPQGGPRATPTVADGVLYTVSTT